MKRTVTFFYAVVCFMFFLITNLNSVSSHAFSFTNNDSQEKPAPANTQEVPASSSSTNSPQLPASASTTPTPQPETRQQLPGKMVFDDPDSTPPRSPFASDKGKTPFDHGQHVAYDGSTCVTCHHTNSAKLTQALEEPVQTCTTCHKEESEVCVVPPYTKEQNKTATDWVSAFHGPTKDTSTSAGAAGCMSCHRQLKEKFPKIKAMLPPVVRNECYGCHIQE